MYVPERQYKVKSLSMHVVDSDSMPSTTHGPLNTTRSDPWHRARSNT